jgi:penicillin-binding protein 1A
VGALFLLAPACAWSTPPLTAAAKLVAESSRIYAADGTLVTTLHGEQDREVVRLSRIPAVLQQAVVAIEDERFWDHRGVDLKAVARAAYENATSGRVVEGGSTITQQYVKNEVLAGRERTLRGKMQEAARA